MGRMIECPLDDLQVTNDADQDIWVLAAGANNSLKLHWFELYSAQTTAENLRLRLLRRTTAGNGGAAVEVKLDEDDGAITAALTTLALVPGTAGDFLKGYQWEQLGPLIFQPTPRMQHKVQEGGFIALNLQTALLATTAMSGFVVWEEI